MKNIFDYIEYYGTYSFREENFNMMDSLIFVMLSYVEFQGILSLGKRDSISFNEACEKFLSTYSQKDFAKKNWLFPSSYRLISMLKESKRYSYVHLSYYVNEVCNEGQFGALTIRIPEVNIVYVSFEGTDSNVVGWKEDFELVYDKPIYSQKRACEYLNDTLGLFDKEVYVGGHSKGGNLAMYAYMNAKPFYKKKIRTVYNFDGPGFLDSVLSSASYLEMEQKLINVYPEESVIGMMLGHRDFIAVKSNAKAIMQHDAYSWQCFGKFLVNGELSEKSKKFSENLKTYLDGMSEEERKAFITGFFKIFEKQKLSNIMQLKEYKFTQILSLIKDITGVSQSTRRNLIAILRLLIGSMK